MLLLVYLFLLSKSALASTEDGDDTECSVELKLDQEADLFFHVMLNLEKADTATARIANLQSRKDAFMCNGIPHTAR